AGFFLATVPMLITEFYRRAFIADESDHFFGLLLQHWILWIIYFLLLISGSVLMILWRMHKTMIYNVDPELFPEGRGRTFTAIGMGMPARLDRLMLPPAPRSDNPESTAITESATPAADPNDSRYGELAIESFPSMCHVTLHWDNYTPELRRQVETELQKCLEAAAPLDNPAAGWFLNLSGMIFGALIVVAVAEVLLIVLFPR